MTKRRRRVTRSIVLFTAGLIGVAMETVYSLRFHQTPDATLVLLFSAMMGLPVYLAQDATAHDDPDDERRRKGSDDDPT